MPLWRSSNNFQVFSASVASAVVMAMPVTTTFGKPLPVANGAISPVEPPCPCSRSHEDEPPFSGAGRQPPSEQHHLQAADQSFGWHQFYHLLVTWIDFIGAA
jgi:hypothetical protein